MTLSGSSIRGGAGSRAVTTEAPHKRESRRGRIPKEPLALYEGGPVTLCSQPKSSPFWINLAGTWLAREWPIEDVIWLVASLLAAWITPRRRAMRLHRIESLSRHFSDKIARKIKVS